MVKIFLMITMWVVAGVISSWIVFGAKIGPILLTVSAEHGWGIHTGDFLAFIPVIFSTVVTWRTLRS